MKPALVKQAHDIRMQAAALLARAEQLLVELREITDITPTPQEREQIPPAHARRVIHVIR